MRKFRIFFQTMQGQKRQKTIKISIADCQAMGIDEINMSDKILDHACYVLNVISKVDYFNTDYVTEIIKDTVTFSKD